MRIISVMFETKLSIYVNLLAIWSNFPANFYILINWDSAFTHFMFPIPRAAINPQLFLVFLPVKNYLIGSIGNAEIRTICFRHDCYGNRGLKRGRCRYAFTFF